MFRMCSVFNTFRPVCHTVGALYFGSDVANLEVLHVSHAVDHFLRLLAESVDRAILFLKSAFFCFFVRVCLELVNQFFGLLPCGCDRALGQPNGAILGF